MSKKKKRKGLSDEQRRLRHERKEAKRAQKKQQQQQQQESSKSNTLKTKTVFKTPEELLTGLMGDVIQLISAEAQLQKFLELRLQMAKELKEKNPLKFNELRCDKFEEIQEEVTSLHEVVAQLAAWVGSINDLTSYKDKMTSIHDNMNLFFDAQVKFDVISKKMETADQQFNAEIARPAVTPDNEDIVTTDTPDLPTVDEDSRPSDEQPSEQPEPVETHPEEASEPNDRVIAVHKLPNPLDTQVDTPPLQPMEQIDRGTY